MRTRAYRPEVVGCLEERSLLSGVAGASADPVVLSRQRLITADLQTVLAFHLFSRDRDPDHVRDAVHDVVVIIPYGRVDGLGVTINDIVTRMQRELSGHNAPHAIRAAGQDVIAAIRADVEARVRAGDVVIR
jgi:hypothetical protein